MLKSVTEYETDRLRQIAIKQYNFFDIRIIRAENEHFENSIVKEKR